MGKGKCHNSNSFGVVDCKVISTFLYNFTDILNFSVFICITFKIRKIKLFETKIVLASERSWILCPSKETLRDFLNDEKEKWMQAGRCAPWLFYQLDTS